MIIMNNTIKIVAIISSSKSHGNTVTLVREALKGAIEEGAEIQEIFLPQYNIEFCTGCFRCMSEGKCPFSDDFETLKTLLKEADGIIFGSPTYAASPNAMMKRFSERLGMFERFTSEVFGGKYVVGISTAGSMGAKKVANDLVGFPKNGIFKRGYVSGTLGIGVGPNSVTENPEALHKAHELGKKIVRDIKNGETYPLQNVFGRMFIGSILKPRFRKIITSDSEGRMKGVYTNLFQRGLL
jgi:multimeric flavodoxin WrbA